MKLDIEFDLDYDSSVKFSSAQKWKSCQEICMYVLLLPMSCGPKEYNTKKDDILRTCSLALCIQYRNVRSIMNVFSKLFQIDANISKLN